MPWPILTEASVYRYLIIAPIVFLACWLFNKYRLKKYMKYAEEHEMDDFDDIDKTEE